MRIAQRLLMATPASIGSKSSLSEALALLPPLQLYRRILRVHRKLEPEMRVLGDSYVKNEFRAHRGVENPLHIIGFLTEWQLYAQKLEGDQWTGDKLDRAKLDKMSGIEDDSFTGSNRFGTTPRAAYVPMYVSHIPGALTRRWPSCEKKCNFSPTSYIRLSCSSIYVAMNQE
ncbi:Pc12g10480 [Penicillium rubens Wisconsin 54-1255]|uniref:Succinate dehydrogenase assembly factor 3 n=1 Tax=Penicillium rubens (strain ATCC 28089 / DSM 1075 / NRRL 1951 / Wisconsin 54-1255) TaxID=500485 RepID=B6H0Q6_PENRW|nr:Pc12g10480 [Penicillium rubens Wisconsin 54-1255]